MSTSAQQIRSFAEPALLSYGFRPFFLFGALWAALAIALWLPMLSGHLVLPSTLGPLEWHVHELIYGYVPAIVAGFLSTAVPNWTGRLPVAGGRDGQRAVSSRGDCRHWRWPWNAARHCGCDSADHADRRPHHSELHPQLARPPKCGPPADTVQSI